MDIEIAAVAIKNKGIVEIEGYDPSEQNMRYCEEKGISPKTMLFRFNTISIVKKSYGYDRLTDRAYLDKWLHRQKTTSGARTYGEALRSTLGTIVTISGNLLVES